MHVNWLCSKCTEMLFLFLWGIYLCLKYAWKGWVKATSCRCFMMVFSIMIRHWRWKKHHGCNHLVSWWYTIIIAIRVQLSPFHFNVSDVRQIGLAAELCLFQRLTRAGPQHKIRCLYSHPFICLPSYVCFSYISKQNTERNVFEVSKSINYGTLCSLYLSWKQPLMFSLYAFIMGFPWTSQVSVMFHWIFTFSCFQIGWSDNYLKWKLQVYTNSGHLWQTMAQRCLV